MEPFSAFRNPFYASKFKFPGSQCTPVSPRPALSHSNNRASSSWQRLESLKRQHGDLADNFEPHVDVSVSPLFWNVLNKEPRRYLASRLLINMNQSETSWTRCAKEFAAGASRPSIMVKIPLELTKYGKPVHVKKVGIKNVVSHRGVVATDIALANLERIEPSESIAKWIAGAICTPPKSHSGDSPQVEKKAEGPLTKSPRIGKEPPSHKKRYLPGVTKSPIYKRRKREVKNCETPFGALDRLLLNRSMTSIDSDKSLTPGNKSFGTREKFVPRILRKTPQKALKYFGAEQDRKEKDPKMLRVPETNDNTIFVDIDNDKLSQDLFDDEIITPTPQIPKIRSTEKKKSDDTEAGLLGRAPQLDERSKVELEEDQSSFYIVQDTEDLPRANAWEKFLRPTQGPLIMETELTPEKKYVADTEKIDFESSSETEERKKDSDSDKTVSDLIEEPTTQDSVEPSKPSGIPTWGSDLQRKSNSVLSPKISEILSINEQNSPQISIVDISIETTPPRTQESPVPVAELLDSAKKKKSRPKKGSLGANLQKLISSQASCVRLWRHQMSRESYFDSSSASSITLLVTEALFQYGKNLYRSEIVKDNYNLLTFFEPREEGGKRSLVVMTNPEFVGPVRLRAGTVFKVYVPWDVLNHGSEKGNLVLHSLYYSVVANPVEVKTEPSDDPSVVEEMRKVIREFDCPCLRSGRLEDSCLTKFTDHKVDVIAEMIKI